MRKTPVGDDVMLDDLVAKTNGYSGAEVIFTAYFSYVCPINKLSLIDCGLVSRSRHECPAREHKQSMCIPSSFHASINSSKTKDQKRIIGIV